MLLIEIFFIFTLLLISYQDIRRQEINVIFLIPTCLLYSFFITIPWFTFIIYTLITIANYWSNERYLGQGDVDVIAAGSLFLVHNEIIFWLLLASVFGLAGIKLSRTQQIPFAPYLTASFIIIAIVKFFY